MHTQNIQNECNEWGKMPQSKHNIVRKQKSIFSHATCNKIKLPANTFRMLTLASCIYTLKCDTRCEYTSLPLSFVRVWVSKSY